MPRLALHLLGQYHATLDGEPVTAFRTDKVRALLAYLAVEISRPHRRETLGALLWSEGSADKVHTNLRQSLCRLRNALDDRECSRPIVLTTTDTIQLNPAECWVDTVEFDRLLQACEQHRHRSLDTCRACASRLTQAVALYRGEFLAGLCIKDSAEYAEWSLTCQQTLHRKMMEALHHLAKFHLYFGESVAAEKCLQRQVAMEPWHESAHRQLMHLYAAQGRRVDAVSQYAVCCRVLVEQLGLAPEAETAALFESIRGGHSFTLRSNRFTGVPAQTSTPIGRAKELAQISETLQNPDCRLLSLVGLGGCGKTHLALEAAALEASAFRDGACFCSLGSIGATQSLGSALAEALEIAHSGIDDGQTQVLLFLQRKEMLLVLDNLEHLPAAEWIALLLQMAPGVVILATTRHQLGIHDEWRMEVYGLAYPEPGSVIAREDARNFAAVQLFIQRAAQTRGGFALTEQNTPDVVRICQQVEGLPLALELAASWVCLMSCSQIADAISESLDFLANTWRDVPVRQRSMRATFDYGWNLLSRKEQDAFACLSLFRGEFSHAAARAVVGDPCAACSRQDGIHERLVPSTGCLFRGFVEKALLQEVRPGRYRLHSLLRQYAEEKLIDGGHAHATARLRYIGYFSGLAARAELAWDGVEAGVWRNRMCQERQNIEIALDWALVHADANPDVAPRLARALTLCRQNS